MMIHLGRGLSPVKRNILNSDPSLKSTVVSCVCDLDATKSASYAGSGQTWANMVAAPADGSAKSAYDFYLGATSSATTDDPAFNGTAGNAAAYFSFDGGDMFQIIANTTLINNTNKTTGSADFWVALAFRFKSSGGSYNMWGTENTTTSVGIRLTCQATNRLQFLQRGDAAATQTVAGSGPLLTDGQDYVVILSRQAGGIVTRMWVNTTTGTDLTHTYDSTTTNASKALQLGISAGGTRMPSGTRIYGFSMGNSFLDNTEAAKIFTAYNTRHGRTYA